MLDINKTAQPLEMTEQNTKKSIKDLIQIKERHAQS